MPAGNTFDCVLVGSESLLVRCGEILRRRGHRICGVVSTDPQVVGWAEARGLARFETASGLARLPAFDYLFSIANFSILSSEVLSLPRKGAINYHNGPLPGYAGLHVTSWAILHRERTHGITWHRMVPEVDAGDILCQRTFDLDAAETAMSLNLKCAEAGVAAFAELVDGLGCGRAAGRKQDLGARTYFPGFRRPAPLLCWVRPAGDLSALVRALDFGPSPNPLARPKLDAGEELFIAGKLDLSDSRSGAAPGTILSADGPVLTVAASDAGVALSGFTTVAGQPLNAAELLVRSGLNVGGRLPVATPEALTRLAALAERAARNEAFWRARLARSVPLELPFVRRGVSPGEPARHVTLSMSLPPGLASSDLPIAAFAAYMGRLCDRDRFDLGFGQGTLRKGMVGLASHFAAHVPLRVDLDFSADVGAVLDALRVEVARVRERGTYAIDLPLRRPGLQSPVLPVVVEQGVDPGASLPPGSECAVRFSPDACHWIYDPAAFDKDDILRMQDGFSTFLQNLDRTRPLARAPLFSPAERRRITVEWNDTRTDVPGDACIHSLFEAQAERTPEVAAVECGTRTLSYRDLNFRANRLAHALRRLGVKPGEPVGICLERSPEMVAGVLGILKAGGAYVPLDPAYPHDRLDFMLRDSRASVLIARRERRAFLPETGVHVLPPDAGPAGPADDENLHLPMRPQDPAYVVYTSGSTGRPKGVIGTHRGAVNRFCWMWRVFPFRPEERCCQKTSLSFVDSVWEIFGSLLRGVPLVLLPDGALKDPRRLVRTLAAARVTRIVLVPSLLQALLDACPDLGGHLPDLYHWTSSGETLHPDLVRRFHDALPGRILLNLYGASEVSADVSWYVTKESDAHVPIGRPIDNTRLYILDRRLEPVPVGVPGELCVGGDGLALGYLHRPDLTGEKFIPDPFSDDSEARLYRTGDRARYLPDGTVDFLGRLDHQVNIRGHRVECGEIETRLRAHPRIREAVVTNRPGKDGLQYLCAYFIPDGPVEAVELRAFLARALPEYMIPGAFVPLKEFPRTPSGKADRKALPEPSLPPEAQGASPRTEAERQLLRIWSEVLGIEPEAVGIRGNFFELGGHSLNAHEALYRINAQFCIERKLADLFAHPTVEAFAAHCLTPAPVQVGRPRRTLPDAALFPLSYTQLFWWAYNFGRTYKTTVPLHHFRLQGPLDVRKLERALGDVLARHESLWARILPYFPAQRFAPPGPFSLPVTDLTGCDPGRAEQRFQEEVDAVVEDSVDLTRRSPMANIRLVSLPENRFGLLMGFPHIVFDGKSWEILMRELQTAYDGEPPGEIESLRETIRHERGRYDAAALDRTAAFWTRYLAGSTPPRVPASWISPPSGECVECLLDEAGLAALQVLSAEHGITLNAVFLSILSLVFYATVGQQEMSLGFLLSDRPEPARNQIGVFHNTVLLRTRVEEALAFRAFLDRVKCDYARVLEYADCPEIVKYAALRASQEDLSPRVLRTAERLAAVPAAVLFPARIPRQIWAMYASFLVPASPIRDPFSFRKKTEQTPAERNAARPLQAILNVLPSFYGGPFKLNLGGAVLTGVDVVHRNPTAYAARESQPFLYLDIGRNQAGRAVVRCRGSLHGSRLQSIGERFAELAERISRHPDRSISALCGLATRDPKRS